jgi:bifunctional non-homologous end joining protein LigD
MSTSAPHFIPPMMAHLADALPGGADWFYEVKLDGIRAIAVKHGDVVKLFSRTPRELTADFPEIVAALRKLRPKQLVLDGEIVALDAEGRSSFQLLQNRKRDPQTISYVIFDVLHVAGTNVTKPALTERRKLLEKLLPKIKLPLRLSPFLPGTPRQIWTEVQRLGLEGVIAKRKNSAYESARRSGAWLKVKAQNEQEFVIGGYTEPRGSRKHFGAILVGYYAKRKLYFASAVGTGFNTNSLRSLYQVFQNYRGSECPFVNLPVTRKNRYGGGLTAAEMKRCSWLKPALVCQVRFYEWTRDGNLRQPVFLGLRDDKKPTEVKRETPSATG